MSVYQCLIPEHLVQDSDDFDDFDDFAEYRFSILQAASVTMGASSVINCTIYIPTCQTIAPKVPWCNGFTNVSNIVYRYEVCKRESIAYAKHNGKMECFCINNPVTDCRADFFYDTCTALFMTSATLMTVIIFWGVFFNLLVCSIYYRRKSIRGKISNILLVNQAIADLVNCLCYALPSTASFFILVTSKTIDPIKIFNREYRHYLNFVCVVMGFLSCCSSLLLYLVVACERWLAFSNPLWHRTRLCSRHIWRSILVLWLCAIGIATLVAFVDDTLYIIYFRTLQGLLLLATIIVTVLFSLTFHKARKVIRRQKGFWRDLSRTKKEFNLTKFFFLMYFLFLITFLPLALANPNELNPARRIKFMFFTLTAVINPLLTQILRKDFKFRSDDSTRRSSTTGSSW